MPPHIFPRIARFVLILGLILAWRGQATSGIITIETTTRVKVTGNRLKVCVTPSNKGTARAHNLQVHVAFLGDEEQGPVITKLDPGDSETVCFKKTFSGIKKGRYPLRVQVDFHDANQYPFSALSGSTFYVGEDVNPDLGALGRDMELHKRGRLVIQVTNMAAEARKIKAGLMLPKEFSCPNPGETFQIPSRSEKALTFEIQNFSALPGARYPVFCFLEYDHNDRHHTALVRALVEITKKENFFRRNKWVWIGLTLFLTLILVTFVVKGRGKRNAA